MFWSWSFEEKSRPSNTSPTNFGRNMHFSGNFVSMTFEDNRFADRFRKSKKNRQKLEGWKNGLGSGSVVVFILAKKAVFARYLCEIFIWHKNVCPQSERAWKMLLFLFFLNKSLAQKLWKIWSMIGLGPVSRDVMRLHWRHMTLFRLTFPKRYSYNPHDNCNL